jgi:hypothetical protein
MHNKIFLSLFLSLAFLHACGRPSESSSILQESTRLNARVDRLADGMWMRLPPSSRFSPPAYSFWIDLAVRKEHASLSEVGIVWTIDNWKTQQSSLARYEAGLEDGREKWGVDVHLPPQHVSSIEYAAYIRVNGQTIWDPHNNYFIGSLAGLDLILTRGETKEDATGIWFEGGIKVKNIAPEKQIIIHYQKDQGSSETVFARYEHGNDWSFRIPLDRSRSTELRFKMEYIVDGKAIVDDNDGRLYNFQIGPRPYRLNGNSTRLSGYEILSFADPNIHALRSLQAFINGKALTVQGLNLFIDSTQLYPESSVELKLIAEDEKGFRTEQIYPFEVSYQVKPLGSFGNGEFRWPRQLHIQKDVLLIADYERPAIFKYAIPQQKLEKWEIDRALQDIAPYGNGNSATLSGLENPTLGLYNPAGELMQSVAIPASVIELPVQLEASGDALYLLSYYENAIAIFDWEGRFQRKIALPYTVKGFKASASEIWVLAYDSQGFESANQYFEILDQDGNSLRKLDYIQQAAREEFSYAQDFALSDDYLIILQNYEFVVLDRRTGRYLTKWTGVTPFFADESSQQIDGAISSTAMSLAVQGNTVYVADFGYHRVSRFELSLE